MNYRAWVAKSAKQPMVLETVDLGLLGAEDIEVAVEHCGLSHSDLSVFNNDMWAELDMTLVACSMQYSNDGHAIDNFTAQHHMQCFGKGKRAHFDKFSLIRRQCGLDEVYAHKQMGGFIHHAFTGMIGADVRQPTGAISYFLGELTLGRCLDGLAR